MTLGVHQILVAVLAALVFQVTRISCADHALIGRLAKNTDGAVEKFRGWLDGVGGLTGVEEYAREHNLTDLLLHVAFAWVVFRFVKSPIVLQERRYLKTAVTMEYSVDGTSERMVIDLSGVWQG